MRVRHGAGIWELFLPRVAYKYAIIGAGGSRVPMKADPVALAEAPIS
jgi:1,4-alpha-glucan branching enzyme